MPGLRSLVARRRSSLASTPPPSSPHSRTNTPSPSFPSSSDHAPPASTLSRIPGEEKDHCLMPGSGEDLTGGEEGAQEEKEAGQDQRQQQEQDTINRIENVTQEATLINGREEEAGSSKSVGDKGNNGPLQVTVPDACESIANEGSERLSSEITRDSVSQGAIETNTQQQESDGDKFPQETNRKTLLSLSVCEENTQQTDDETVHVNDGSSRVPSQAVTGSSKNECLGEGICASDCVREDLDTCSPSTSGKGTKPTSWPSYIGGVEEFGRLLSTTSTDSVCERGAVDSCEEEDNKPYEYKTGIEESENVKKAEECQGDDRKQLISGEESEQCKDVSSKYMDKISQSRESEGSDYHMNLDASLAPGLGKTMQYRSWEENKESESVAYPVGTETKECEGRESMDCEAGGEEGVLWDRVVGAEVRRATEGTDILAENQYQENLAGLECGADGKKESVVGSGMEESKDYGRWEENLEKHIGTGMVGEAEEEMMDYDNWGETQEDEVAGSEDDAQTSIKFSVARESVGYPCLETIEPYELGRENVAYENREEGKTCDEEEFMEYEGEANLDEYQKDAEIYESEQSEKSRSEEKIYSLESEAAVKLRKDEGVSEIYTDKRGTELCREERDTGLVRKWKENVHPRVEEGSEGNARLAMTNPITSQNVLYTGDQQEAELRTEFSMAGGRSDNRTASYHTTNEYNAPMFLDSGVSEGARGETLDYGSSDYNVHEFYNPNLQLKRENPDELSEGGNIEQEYREDPFSESKYTDGSHSHTDQDRRMKYDDEMLSGDSIQEIEASAAYLKTEISSEDINRCLKESDKADSKPAEEDCKIALENEKPEYPSAECNESEKHLVTSSEGSGSRTVAADKSNEGASQDSSNVVGDKSQASVSSKNEGTRGVLVNNKRPYPFTVSPKVKKGPGRCSELSATEIESTLASRGVTIVRRMVDSKDNTNRGNNESPQNTKKESSPKSGVVVTPHMRNTRQSARLQSLYKTKGRPDLREYGPPMPLAINPAIHTQPGGQGSSGITKDLFRSINARGTLIHPGAKTPQTLSNLKGGALQFNTRGVSIQFNPKGATSNLNVRGSAIYSKTRGPNIYTNAKGTNLQLNPKGVSMQGTPRIFNASNRSRGGIHQSLRGTNLQANPRALANLANQRGLPRPMRYTSPRGALRPSFPGTTPLPRSPTLNPRMRGIGPHAFKTGTNQLQSNTSGLAQLPKSTMGLPVSKSGTASLHSTSSNITQGRSVKLSPHSQSTGITSQFKSGDLMSQFKSGTGNVSLQSNLAGMSPQQQGSEGMLSPRNRSTGMSPHSISAGMSPHSISAGMSPHSRPTQISPQSVDTGVYAQSKYAGLSTQSNVGLSPQGMMLNQSKSGVPRSPAANTTTQPRPSLPAGHLPVPSSSQHLAHMGMMEYSTQSGTGVGLPHSSANNRLLPPHTVAGGLMPQGSSSLTSQLVMSSGLSPLATSESFTTSATESFPSLSHSEFLGRSTSETFSPYSTLSDFPPHSSATTDFPASLNTGDFTMQSTAGGFPAQTNLVGFSPQTNPCGYPQHPSSGGFTSHNSGSVIGHTGTDGFASPHPTCGNFTPAPVNASGYPPHSTTPLYSTATNPSDILGYPGSRDFMMTPSSREFSTYSASTPLTNQLPQEMSTSTTHRDLQLNQHPREFSLQNSNSGISLASNTGNSSLNTIVGEQYSQQSYGDPLTHSSYQQDSLHSRSNPSDVSLLPDLRDSPLRHNFRESSVPLYGNFRDPVTQDNLRTSQMQGSYRDMPLNPSMSTVQPHAAAGSRTQSLQTNFKDQSVPSTYRDQDIITNYLESSVLNYRDPGEMGTCPEQTNPAYRPASSHTSPSEQVLPSFSNPASHPSPQEQQVLSNFSDSASPRDQVLPPQPCRDSGGQLSTGESVLPGFRDTMNSSTSTHQDLVGFRDSLTYTGYRESGNYGIGCEKPGSNTSDYASSSSRHSDVAQSGRSSSYKDPHIVPGYSITDPQNSMKYKDELGTCGDGNILPSFTESFDSTSPNDVNRKDNNSTLSHYKTLSEYGSLKGSPASVSTEGTAASPYVNHHTGEMSPLTNPHSYIPEPNTYQSKRVYGAQPQPHDPYSPAHQYSEDGGSGGGHLSKGASNSYTSPRDQFFHEALSVHTTMTTSPHCGPKNLVAKSDMTGCLSQPVVSDSQLPSGVSNVQEPSGSRNITSVTGHHILPDRKEQPRDASPNHLYHGDKGPLGDTQEPSLGFHKDPKKVSVTQVSTQMTPNADELLERINYQPFLGGDSLSPSCPITAANKFPSVSSPTKSDSNSSPSTQERIVIKMKLLPANSAMEKDGELVEDANISEAGANSKNSVKYSMAKYTRWTIDSIINGSEEGSDGASKEEDCKIIQPDKDESTDPVMTLKRTSKQRTSESCSDVKDANLDTNKNLMKKSLKITITNPHRARISSDEDSEAGKVKEKSCESESLELKKGEGEVKEEKEIKVLEEKSVGISKKEKEKGCPKSRRSSRNRRARSPSPTPSVESCSSSSSVSRGSCESSTSSIHSEAGDPQVSGDLKKCSIVIKRIYTDNNYSCYSSSLCNDNNTLSLDEEVCRRRPKRKAAVEATQRCHKFLRPLDANSAKVGKNPPPPQKSKDVMEIPPDKKNMEENIPQCSVLLYDVFMDSRLNKLSCPGCSRHYDSTDSIQVNISKATISLLCSECQWLVVKNVSPHEIISSLAPS